MGGITILETDKIPSIYQIGKKYHCSWARPGAVWKLISLNGKEATLETPKTKKTIRTHVANLRYIRKDAEEAARTRRLIEKRDQEYVEDLEDPNRCLICNAIVPEDEDYCSEFCHDTMMNALTEE